MATKPSKGKVKKKAGSRTAFASNWPIIREQIKYIDLLIEVCDARAPQSSRHPKVREIFGNKPLLLIMNKADLADRSAVQRYMQALNQDANQKTIALSLKASRNKQMLFDLIGELTKEKREKLERQGINTKVIRTCVIGMPNVGKSSLINWLAGRKRAKVANLPGVTRGPQWIKLSAELELLDTPGVLPRENMDKHTRNILMTLNLVALDPGEMELLANNALQFMKRHYPKVLKNYLGVEEEEKINFESLAIKRNFLSVGGKYDLIRAANTFLIDLRDGKLGQICLDMENSIS